MDPTKSLTPIIIRVALMGLLYLPCYYTTLAAQVLQALLNQGRRCGDTATTAVENTETLIMQPETVHLDTTFHSFSMLPEHAQVPEGLLDDPSKNVKIYWEAFVTRFNAGWIVISSLSVAFIMASPSALQALCDPLTRSFIYVSIFRAVSAIVYSTRYLIYFRNPETLTEQFARAFLKGTTQHQEFVASRPWMILSLPAVAFSWGALSLFVALMLSMWRGTAMAHVPESIGLAAKLMITILRVADLACLVWISAMLRRVKHDAKQLAPIASDF